MHLVALSASVWILTLYFMIQSNPLQTSVRCRVARYLHLIYFFPTLIADSQTRRLFFSFDLHVIITARSFRDLEVPLILSKPKDPGWSSLIPTLQLQLNTINEDTISGMEKFQTGKTNDLGFLPGLMIDGNREVMQIFAIRTEVRGKSLKISGSVICQRKLLA